MRKNEYNSLDEFCAEYDGFYKSEIVEKHRGLEFIGSFLCVSWTLDSHGQEKTVPKDGLCGYIGTRFCFGPFLSSGLGLQG